MRPSIALALSALVASSSGPSPVNAAVLSRTQKSVSVTEACKEISRSVSSSKLVSYPGSSNYAAVVDRWIKNTSINSTCVVEPATTADVSAVIKVLGAYPVPFGIKGGGHSFNSNFSSTTGIQIGMTHFNEVTYSPSAGTVKIGMGTTWDHVYSVLDGYNVTVSGGRVVGVGVGGFLLGGGYSFLSDEVGLAMEYVLSYEIVLPTGKIVTASKTQNADLFWGLKGGGNNFGIATSVVVKAVSHNHVYAGELMFPESSVPMLAGAITNFSNMETGPNPITLGSVHLAYSSTPAGKGAVLNTLYHGESPPTDWLSAFDEVPHGSNVAVYNFSQAITVLSSIFDGTDVLRAAADVVMVHNTTETIVQQFMNIADTLVSLVPSMKNVNLLVEPWVPSAVTGPLSEGLYPHDVYGALYLLAVFYSDEADDTLATNILKDAIAMMTDILRADGQPVEDMMLYNNYANSFNSVERLYGPNLDRAKKLRKQIDPQGVMLRTGGFKLV
ncbi:FAD-binding domain-containing protein [Clavulina sp. PMI_390]|nr:FAD-binding domain-containing protein [Clavulina sp. PMI_390]